MLCPRSNIVPTLMKEKWLQIRINETIKDDLKVVAELHGLSVSALIHSLIVKMIREEKHITPHAFERQKSKGRRLAPNSTHPLPMPAVRKRKVG